MKIIEEYNDGVPIGNWGSINVETGETTRSGEMYSHTVKVRYDDGSVGLEKNWVTDEDIKRNSWRHPMKFEGTIPLPAETPRVTLLKRFMNFFKNKI